MSGHGRPNPSSSPQLPEGLKVVVVASSWHEQVMTGLINGAERCLVDRGLPDVPVVRVPGSYELPVVVQHLAHQGYEAIIALGVVIRGGTPHFDYVCRAATDGLTRVALDHGVAVGFGLLTCDNDEQAVDRAGLVGSREDKGYEAAAAATDTALLLRSAGLT